MCVGVSLSLSTSDNTQPVRVLCYDLLRTHAQPRLHPLLSVAAVWPLALQYKQGTPCAVFSLFLFQWHVG